MSKQVIDIAAGKGMTLSQSNEHLRVAFKGAYISRLSGNFDPTREHLNFEVKRGGIISSLDKAYSIPKRIRDILNKRGITDPNKGMLNPYYRTVANVILQGSRDQMHRLAFGDQQVNLSKGADNSSIERSPEIERWAVDMYKFMSTKYGEENIAAFIVHLDETNPHIHCTLLPINKKNKFSWKDYWGHTKEEGRKIYLQLHDELSDVNKKYGLERGEDKTRTGAKHRTTAQYRADLSERLRKENENLINENRQMEVSVIHARARLKALNTMIEHQKENLNRLNSEIHDLEDKLAKGKITQEEHDQKLAKLQEEVDKCKANLFDKQEKLKIAQEKLDEVLAKVSKEDEKLSSVSEKIDKAKKDLDVTLSERDKLKFNEMQSFAFSATTFGMKERFEKYQENLSKLTPQQKAFVENINRPFFEDGGVDLNVRELAEDGADVMSISTNLFLGYLNNATKISQGSGGGGGPTSGWGKQDDEDDYAFMRRCFRMARHMKSSGRSSGRKR